jgi:hypothetical protein
MKIPVYEQQIVPNQTPDIPRVAVDQSGAGIAAVGEGLLNLAGALHQREKAKSQVWFADASGKADTALRDMLYDQQKRAAPGATNFTDTYLKSVDEYAEKAVNNAPEIVRDRMKAHLAGSRESLAMMAMQYENQEEFRHMGEQFDGAVSTSSKLVTQSPELFENEMGKLLMTVNEMPTTPEGRAGLKENARKGLAWSAVTGEIDRNPAMEKLSGKAFDMLTADEQKRANDYLDSKKREFKTQKQAGAFIEIAKSTVSGASLLPGDNIDIGKAKANAVAAAKKQGLVLDPESQLALETRVEYAIGDRLRDVKNTRDVNTAMMFAELDKNGGDYQAVLEKYPWLSSQPTEMQTRINDYAGAVATGGTRKTDWQAYNMLINNPDALKTANIDAMSDKFNSREKSQLLKLQKGLNDPVAEQNLVTTSSLVKNMLKDAGYEGDEASAKFHSLLQSSIDQELALTGKKQLPQTRVKELAADLLVEQVTSKGIIWDSDETAFNIEVPETEKVKIQASLEAAGLPVSDYNVLQAYRNILRKRNGQ